MAPVARRPAAQALSPERAGRDDARRPSPAVVDHRRGARPGLARWGGPPGGRAPHRAGVKGTRPPSPRDRGDALGEAGLTEEEAFLSAVKRLGSMDEISREYAAEHSGRLWKQLVLHDSLDTEAADGSTGTIPFARRANGLAVALLLGVGAGIAVKATELLTGEPELVVRNIAVLVLPFLAAWFAWRRRPPARPLLGPPPAVAAGA